MRYLLTILSAVFLLPVFAPTDASAQTAGTARMEVTINNYAGTSGTAHWTVAWVTSQSGTFIKSLRRQGPGFSNSDWANHCGTWNTARAGSTVLDGYTSATAANYSGTNSPIIQNWNGRDANNNLVPDGNYKFWVQYAENSGQGPVTTTGLLWTKGPGGITNNYANQGANFTGMKVTWIPASSTVPPTITSAVPAPTATVGVPYQHTCTATGTLPITFTAAKLPPGLAMNAAGIISGTPTSPGPFSGTITAANGTPPDATQAFTITVGVVPTTIGTATLKGDEFILTGQGPANGDYSVLAATNVSTVIDQWTSIGTSKFDPAGQFRYTNVISTNVPLQYYRIRIP